MKKVLNSKITPGILITVLFMISYGCIYPQADKKFADYLFSKGEYYRAITEYYRAIFTSGDTVGNRDCLRGIAACYITGEDYEGFIDFYQRNKNLFISDPDISREMTLLEGECFLKIKSYNKAILTLQKIKTADDDDLNYKKHYLLALSFAHIDDWDQVRKNLAIINKNKSNNVQGYSEHQSVLMPDISGKSPLLAGILSGIIPGTGYIYCGRIFTGITSFILNGLFIWAFSDAVKNKHYGLASGTGLLALGWYTGSIYGSVNAAYEYNESAQLEYINKIIPGLK